MEMLSVWELHKPAQCLPPYLSHFQCLPLSLLVIFILCTAQCPHRLSTQLSTVILSILTRKGLPDVHLDMGWGCISDSIEMHLRLLVLPCGCSYWRHGYGYDPNKGCFLLVQTCSLMSTQCNGEDDLQYYFLHTLFPVVLHCQTSICI